MELKGSKTEQNLMDAFAGESQARNKYTYYASKAKKDGYVQVAKIFEETAGNEKEHAEIWFKLLQTNSEVADTLVNLKEAAAGEHFENTNMYPRMAKEAAAEGFKKISKLFEMVGSIEKEHEARYNELAGNIDKGIVFSREGDMVWKCSNCGYIHIGKTAPKTCPVCQHPQAYFELQSKNY